MKKIISQTYLIILIILLANAVYNIINLLTFMSIDKAREIKHEIFPSYVKEQYYKL